LADLDPDPRIRKYLILLCGSGMFIRIPDPDFTISDLGLGSEIRKKTYSGSQILNPWVKKEPDPGSRSTTLLSTGNVKPTSF
jgi:hypothetical protein